MKEKIVKLKRQKFKDYHTKEQNMERYTMFALSALAVLLHFLKLVWNKFTTTQELVINIVLVVIYALFVVELVMRLLHKRKVEGKDFLLDYWKFNKVEIAYTIIYPIIMILAFTTGDHNNLVEFLEWVIIFKFISVLRLFDDEKIFEVVCCSIMVLLIALFIMPFMYLISYALSKPFIRVGLIPTDIDLYSINFIIRYKPMWEAMFLSISVTILGTLISTFTMSLCAYPLSKTDMPFKKFLLVFFVICMLFSGGMAPKIMLMDILGLIDNYWVLILPSVVDIFNLLLVKGFFEGLPDELEESAKLDGASNFQIFFKIFVPLAVPMVVTVAMFTAVDYWNNYYNTLLYVVARTDLYTLPYFIKEFVALEGKQFSTGDTESGDHIENMKMALMIVSMIPVVMIYPFSLKYFSKGVTVGSVKG